MFSLPVVLFRQTLIFSGLKEKVRLVIIIEGYCFNVWVLREMMILRAGYSRLALEERFGAF